MKRIFLFLIIFSLVLVKMEFSINSGNTVVSVMSDIEDINLESDYDLTFEDENLNLSNFKLKFASFTSYNYQIKRVYFFLDIVDSEYFKNKEYFSFIGNNLNEGIDNLKSQYLLIIKNNNLHSDIDNITNNYINIRKVRIYTSSKAIEEFKIKYPKVKVDKIN